MLGHSLGRNCKVTNVKTFQSAAQSTVTSTRVDMAGYEGVMFIVSMGVIDGSATTTCYVRQDTATGMGGGAQIAGTVITIADDDDDYAFVMDVYRPEERYLDVQVTRTTSNSEVESIVAIQYGARKVPVTHDSSTVADATYVAGPAEGT